MILVYLLERIKKIFLLLLLLPLAVFSQEKKVENLYFFEQKEKTPYENSLNKLNIEEKKFKRSAIGFDIFSNIMMQFQNHSPNISKKDFGIKSGGNQSINMGAGFNYDITPFLSVSLEFSMFFSKYIYFENLKQYFLSQQETNNSEHTTAEVFNFLMDVPLNFKINLTAKLGLMLSPMLSFYFRTTYKNDNENTTNNSQMKELNSLFLKNGRWFYFGMAFGFFCKLSDNTTVLIRSKAYIPLYNMWNKPSGSFVLRDWMLSAGLGVYFSWNL